MNYYKITNANEVHYGLTYKTGLNIDPLPFNPTGNCQDGGIYFAREDILEFFNHGPWLRKVTLPPDARIYENPGKPKKWKADKVILDRKRKITVKVIEELIKEGARLSIHTLNLAIIYGRIEMAKLLLKHNCPIDPYIINLAIEYGRTEMVKLLLKHNCLINAYIVKTAIKYGQLEIIKLLLKHNCAIDTNTINLAIEYGHIEIVKLLLKHNCPVNTYAINLAINYGHTEIAKLLKTYKKIC